jgi:hypothetical protein
MAARTHAIFGTVLDSKGEVIGHFIQCNCSEEAMLSRMAMQYEDDRDIDPAIFAQQMKELCRTDAKLERYRPRHKTLGRKANLIPASARRRPYIGEQA